MITAPCLLALRPFGGARLRLGLAVVRHLVTWTPNFCMEAAPLTTLLGPNQGLVHTAGVAGEVLLGLGTALANGFAAKGLLLGAPLVFPTIRDLAIEVHELTADLLHSTAMDFHLMGPLVHGT